MLGKFEKREKDLELVKNNRKKEILERIKGA